MTPGWKYAAGGLDFDYSGFVHTVLVDMRARLAASKAPTRATVVPADEPAGAPLPDLTGWLAGLRGRVPGSTVPGRGCARKARLGPWDLGEWPGRPLRELDELSWRSDPAFTGYGGESLLASSERVRLLLAGWHRGTGRGGAVTHAPVIELAVVQGLRAPCGTSRTSTLHPLDDQAAQHPSVWRVTAVSCRQATPTTCAGQRTGHGDAYPCARCYCQCLAATRTGTRRKRAPSRMAAAAGSAPPTGTAGGRPLTTERSPTMKASAPTK